jgi:hypothetical protein
MIISTPDFAVLTSLPGGPHVFVHVRVCLIVFKVRLNTLPFAVGPSEIHFRSLCRNGILYQNQLFNVFIYGKAGVAYLVSKVHYGLKNRCTRFPVEQRLFSSAPRWDRPWSQPSLLPVGYRCFSRDKAFGTLSWPRTSVKCRVKNTELYLQFAFFMALYLTEHVDSVAFCLRLVHFSSYSGWFSVPPFMHSYDSSPLFSIVGLACCKRFTTFRLPKIINTLYNGSTMRAPARRAFHLLQAARQLTPLVRLKIQGSFSNNISHWSDDKHIASFSTVTASGQILSSTMSQKHSVSC